MLSKDPEDTSSAVRPPERRTIAHYQIESLLCTGGMGEVYAALDTRLGRLIALKLLPQDVTSDNDRLRRFQQEARTVSALNHPNIMTVYEIGEADSRHYIATELVKGATLRSRMAKPLPIAETVDIAIQIASALAAAQEAGVIHRDVKPENVMIRTDGYVKLLDFGLAKLNESTGGSLMATDVQTMPGTVMGTVHYMSPEQTRGEELDGRSDLWSLGVLMYEMLAGRKPFEGQAASDVMGQILQNEPPPLARFAADVPSELERIVRRCLRKSPDERYQSANDLLLDLKELRRQLEMRDSQPRPFARFSRRALMATAAGAIVLAAIAGVLLLGLPRRSAALTQQDTVLLADFTNRTGDPVFDGTLRDALAVQLGQSPFLNLVADSRIRETLRYMGRSPDEKLTIPIAREICQRQGIKAILTGSIAQLGSQYVLTVEALNGQSGDALVREQVQVARKEDVLHSLGPAVSTVRGKLGESLRSVQKFDTPVEQATTSSLEALRAFSVGSELATAGKNHDAIPFFQRAIEIDPQFALAHTRLASAFYNTFEGDADAEAMKAYQLRERSTERERFYIEQMYFQGVTGEIEKAIETLQLWERTYPNDSLAHLGLAVNYENLCRYDEALDESRKSITLDPNWSYSYLIEAHALRHLNRGAEARAVLELAVSRKFDSQYIRGDLFLIGAIQNDERLMQRQVQWAANNPMGDWVFASQGESALSHGRGGEALASFRHAADVANARRGGRDSAAWDVAEYALWSALFGRTAEAAALSKESLRMSTRSTLILLWLGRAFALSGHGDEASRIADELAAKHPNDTLVKRVWVPTIRAAVAIVCRNDAATGIDLLRTTAPYETYYDGMPVLLRGMAYLRQKDAVRAAEEFDKIRANPDWFKRLPTYAIATLCAARAAALGGNVGRSRQLYGEFLQLWKDADPDLPIFMEAKREYAALTQ